MVQSFSLQTRMITSFLFMGLIVLIVALIGLSATSKLSGHIAAIGGNSLPSISGLWKINEGQTQIQSSEQVLLNPFLSKENQKVELTRIKETGKQIDEGFTEYNSAPKFPGEEELYQKFLKDWEIWKEKHNEFLRLYRQFQELGIANPITVQVQLLSQDQGNSPTMASAKTAAALLNKLSALSANEIRTSFESANNSLLDIVKLNYDMAKVAQKNSAEDVSRNTFWVWVGMIIGPISALVLGIYFSVTIAKPLGAKIAGIVNAIVSSSREIAITVEQQERTANQQASAVHQTTTTMNQLSASSNQSAQQAATATASARQALNQAEAGTKAVEETLVGMATLKEKVEAIAEQIKHLSEQTSLIGNISTVVSELANQTNMLALNAAVEAVRAGEHGRGFGIVAAEIRKLADQSKQSAHKINTLVTDIQNAINSTVIVTDQGTKTAETGARITQETAHAFTDIASAINGVFESSQQISQNAQQQAMAIQQVVDTMKALNQAAVETASGISQTKLSTQQLNEVALNLKALV